MFVISRVPYDKTTALGICFHFTIENLYIWVFLASYWCSFGVFVGFAYYFIAFCSDFANHIQSINGRVNVGRELLSVIELHSNIKRYFIEFSLKNYEYEIILL